MAYFANNKHFFNTESHTAKLHSHLCKLPTKWEMETIAE